jgi:hypothetical protein
MTRTLRGLVASLMAAGVVLGLMAVPAGAQEETITEIVDITLDGCDIVVTFTAADAGEYHIQIWDDGEQIGDVPVTAEAGATAVGRYRLTAVVKQGASGLGIELVDAQGLSFDGVDPYNGADDVIDFCAAQSTSTTAPSEPPAEPPAAPAENIEPEVAPAATPVVKDPSFTG